MSEALIYSRPSRLEEVFKEEKKADKLVQLLDPLGLDGFFTQEFPGINRRKANDSLERAIRHFVPNPDFLTGIDILSARAVTRDVGFMVAAYVTNGGRTEDIHPAIDTLTAMSSVTQEVPRDTVYSYGLRNPHDHRMRTFTTLDEERLFITSFSQAMVDLPTSIQALQSARDNINEPMHVVENLEEARKSFGGMIRSILEVKHSVPEAVFSFQLRPYFPPISIEGRTFYGPGGAQMPILLLDTILWASDGNGALRLDYAEYHRDNVQYLPEPLREASSLLTEQQSLVDLFLQRQKEVPYQHVGVELIRLATEIGKFRYPHYRVAKANMEIRPTNSVGSGGYDLAVLEMLIKNLNVYKNRLTVTK